VITELNKRVREELCPCGNWHLSDFVEKFLKHQVNRLPKREVSDEEARYPKKPSDMRAFLDTFFARHYFQVQNSLIDYMTSEVFFDILNSQELNILDIGSGPAVAPLAITDLLAYILGNIRSIDATANVKNIKINYILNDTSSICLGTGFEFLRNYFRFNKYPQNKVLNALTFRIEKSFPSNIEQLKRISRNLNFYHLIIFSYVINLLNEEEGFLSTINGIKQLETLCHPNGRLLILQDKFNESLTRRIATALGCSCKKNVLRQYTYSTINSNDLYTYSYYQCLFPPYRNKCKFGIKPA